MLSKCSTPVTSGPMLSGFSPRNLKGNSSANAWPFLVEANWMALEMVLFPVPFGANLIFSLPASMDTLADVMLLHCLISISILPSLYCWPVSLRRDLPANNWGPRFPTLRCGLS
ncbi:hypothetical protein D3C85_1244730 [compost metagenome]